MRPFTLHQLSSFLATYLARSARGSLVAVLAMAWLTVVAGAGMAKPAAAQTTLPSPDFPHDFPDPDVVVVGGTYFAYSTGSYFTNIQVMSSPDLVHWSAVSDALPRLAPWVTWGYTWAPGVVADPTDGDYVMFYAARETASGRQCIGRATSASPSGPFVDGSSRPFLCQESAGGSIDPSVFTDGGGQSYLLWKNDGNAIGATTYIYSAPIKSTLDALDGPSTPILAPDQAWEGDLVEGPTMAKVGGEYHLLFSANAYATPNYAIGHAICTGPLGPCRSDPANPVLAGTGQASGPGGPSFFNSIDGTLLVAYHAWMNGVVGYPAGVRALYVTGIDVQGSRLAFADAPPPPGYWEVGADGGIFTFGSAPFLGSTGNLRLNQPVVGMARDPATGGYWFVAADGGVFSFDAPFFGSMGGIRLNEPVVGMAATADGRGYWLVAADGGIFSFGDAAFLGSTGNLWLNRPVVGMVRDPATGGYWLVASDGGIFSFRAPFLGSTGDLALNAPITGMAARPDGSGYWLLAADGGVFSFGGAGFFGSLAGYWLPNPVVGLAAAPDGNGYWLVSSDGGIAAFGTARQLGSMGGRSLTAPVVGMASAT